MGSGTMPVKNYRTKKGYYLAQDFDEKIGGSMHMAIGEAFQEAGGKNESERLF